MGRKRYLKSWEEFKETLEEAGYSDWRVYYSPYLDKIKLGDWKGREIQPLNDKGNRFLRYRRLSSTYVHIGNLVS